MEGDQALVFEQLKKASENKYRDIKSLFCPALGSMVVFNADGFHHLRYYNSRSERPKRVQVNKLTCFKNVPDVLSKTTTIQEYRRTICPTGKADRSGYRAVSVVEWFGFIAIINLEKKIRIKIVVRRIGQQDGKYHFWSVMPYWRLNSGIRITGATDLEDD